MDANNKFRNIKGQEGQAIFEMLVFFPFIVLLFTLMVTVGNSINGSINQQKATRAYYYFSFANDSMGAPVADMKRHASEGVISSGMYAFGWREKNEGQSPFGTCYQMHKMLGNSENDTCDEPDVGEESTAFIRVFTAYGLCTGVQRSDDGSNFYLNRLYGGGLETCVNNDQ